MITKEQLLSLQSFATEEEYRESSSLNYSLLKDLIRGPAALVTERSLRASSALSVGNYVDKYFTDRENLNNFFSVDRKVKFPGLIQVLFDHFIAQEIYEPTSEEIISTCRALGLYEKVTDEQKILTKIPESFHEHLKSKRDSLGKVMLTADEYTQSLNAIANIEQCPQAVDLLRENEDEIVLYQFKIEFPLQLESGNIRMFKAMLDHLKVNLRTLEIFGTDIKTGARHSHKFYDQFIEYRHDIQGIVYYWALLAIRKLILERYGVTLVLPSSENFRFLYSPKMRNKLPIIMTLDDKWIKLNGGEYLTHNGVNYPGCWRLINDADWYISNSEYQNHIVVAQQVQHSVSQLSKYII